MTASDRAGDRAIGDEAGKASSRRRPPLVGVAATSAVDDQAAFSGTPAALARGLRETSVEVVGLTARPPPWLEAAVDRVGIVLKLRPRCLLAHGPREAVHDGATRLVSSKVTRRLRTVQFARSLRRAGSIDVCVQFGTDFDPPTRLRYVTYDDQTIIQAARQFAYPWITRLSERELAWVTTRQRRVFERADCCCVASFEAAKSLAVDYGIVPEKIRVVGIGPNNRTSFAAGRDWSVPRFLFVGRDWERKNGPMVLDAFVDLRARHPDAQLHLVGDHPYIREPGVVDHQVLDPRVSRDARRLAHLYAAATCFVLPSRYEPAGSSYVEAMGAGVGSIGSTSGGARTLIGGTGCVVDPTAADEIGAALERFCDAGFARACGQAALERSRLLSWRRVAERLLAAATGEPDENELKS